MLQWPDCGWVLHDSIWIVLVFTVDNVFAIKTWVKNKLAVEESVIDKQFEIPDNFDYVEWAMHVTVALYISSCLLSESKFCV